MIRILDFFFAARPLLQLPIWTVYLIALHYHHELSGETFGWSDLLTMAGINLIFTGAAYLNQVYDYESDRLNNKVGFLQRGWLSQKQLLIAFTVVSIIPMIIGPLISLFTFFVFAQLLVLSYTYSAPPLRLKDRPIGGLVANGYGHGLLVAIAVMPDITLHNAGLLGWDNPLYFFLSVGAIYIVTTIPDRAGDKATGKQTLAVALGRTWALLLALVLMVLSAVVAYASTYAALVYLSIFASFLILGALMIRTEASIRFVAKMPLLLLTLIAGYHYPIYLLFVVALFVATRAYYHRRFGIIYPELA
jgi:4-hydroxybenzoate polyprenyltransferase